MQQRTKLSQFTINNNTFNTTSESKQKIVHISLLKYMNKGRNFGRNIIL